MRKLLLNCGLSPGDVVMLTAAVRDLHHWYPGRFVTDVRTVCPDLWINNPYLTPLAKEDSTVEQIDCSYPLIDSCNETPYHCLHGFIEFLNDRLGLAIKPTAFRGDIHLSAQEKAWYSQVHEATGQDTPFWIVAAGGKYDITIKWWESARYQQVVDHFRGRLQFVQVGDYGHHHPRLKGVIDLRGRTSLRELIRLVYHAQGVLCSVTALMHLAAAVETRPGRPANRACVVVAGGREPAHWEAYPDHQFIHTNGALPCCANGGCWKDRTTRLRDGDPRDRPQNLCVDVVNALPHCLDLITPAEVICRIELYFAGGALNYLSPREIKAAELGIAATAKNPYDEQPLNLAGAGMACEKFIQNIAPDPPQYQGRGIVLCGGGIRYFTNAWVCIKVLRRLGCRLPIELWHLNAGEMDGRMKSLLVPLGVQCVDASKVRQQHPARILHGWELKPYAILHSSFREVLFLDADNVPVVNPEFLFETPQFQSTSAIFWPDYNRGKDPKAALIWRSCGLRQPAQEFETGQIVVDKDRCWRALQLCLWFNENSDFYYRHLHGDKETFHLAFRKLKQRYSLVPVKIHQLDGTMCQHDFQGRRIFQHRNTDKWDIFQRNRRVPDFWFEDECRAYITELRNLWDCGMKALRRQGGKALIRRKSRPLAFKLGAVMVSTAGRDTLRTKTLKNLAHTDWGEAPINLQIDDLSNPAFAADPSQSVYLALNQALESPADYVLLLDDDLDFNRHLRRNLECWRPLKLGSVTLASLLNPAVKELACDFANNARMVAPRSVFGSGAFLLSRATIAYVVRHWKKATGPSVARLSRLAGRLKSPILYHSPSLVQYAGAEDASDSLVRKAVDFDPNWIA